MNDMWMVKQLKACELFLDKFSASCVAAYLPFLHDFYSTDYVGLQVACLIDVTEISSTQNLRLLVKLLEARHCANSTEPSKIDHFGLVNDCSPRRCHCAQKRFSI